MAQRPPTPTVEVTEQYQPQSSPVDTFVRVGEPPKNPLFALADALGGLSGVLDGFHEKNKAKTEAVDKAKATKAFYNNNRMGYNEAVKRGVIPPHQSPAFTEAWKNAEGDHLGQQLSNDATIAYEMWAGKDSTDPQVFDLWVNDTMGKLSSSLSDDPEVVKGLVPYLAKVTEELHQTHEANMAKNVYNKSLNANVAAATEGLNTWAVGGVRDEKDTTTDPKVLWNKMLERRAAAIETGIKADDFDKQVVDMIVNKAVELDEPSMYSLFENKLPGTDYAMKDDPRFRDSIVASKAKLEELSVARSREERLAREAADKARLAELKSGAIESMVKDPMALLPDELLKEGAKLDPQFRLDMIDAQKKLIDNRGGYEDPTGMAQLYKDVSQGGGTKAVMDAIKWGVLKNPESITKAMGYAKSLEDKSDHPVKQLQDSQVYKRVQRFIKDKTMPTDWDKDFAPEGMTEEGLQAERYLNEQVFALAQRGVDLKDPVAVDREMTRIEDSIIKNLDMENRTFMGAGTDEKSVKTFQEQQRQAEAERLKQEAAAGQPPPPAPMPEGVEDLGPPPPDMPKFETISPGLKKMIEAEADKRAVDPAKLYERLYLKQQKRKGITAQPGDIGALNKNVPDGAPPLAAQSPDTKARVEEMAKTFGIQPDKAWEQMWKLIPPESRKVYLPKEGSAQPFAGTFGIGMGAKAPSPIHAVIQQAEAPQGYSSVWNGSPIQPPKPVDQMTVGEVLNFQQEMLNAGADSTAVGGYQFINKTLRGLVENNDIDLNAAFDAGMQDKLAGILMEGRGLSKFMAGKMSAEQFADNLAKEWAGLPMSDGITYHRDGKAGELNKATVDRQTLIQSLEAMRNGGGGQEQSNSGTFTLGEPQGMVEQGNIDLDRRKVLKNEDGSISTEQSFSTNIDGEEVLLPTIINGKRVSEEEAIAHYQKTGEHLGKFNNPQDAERYAEMLHNRQASVYGDNGVRMPGGNDVPDVYANIPRTDGRGEDQIAKFMEWNPDPIGNEQQTLSSVDPQLAQLVAEVRKDSPVKFVVASGKRSAELQAKAMKWGWSKKEDSHHLTGKAVDIWVLDDQGRVIFDKKKQYDLGKAIKAAIKRTGINASWGGDWKRFSDLPHIELN
ncbi:M15 family metallopeptidase [Aestuariivirga sp.]|uniref:M15 family metallopeptidase n=1 Tax=Aestuariivirga sp. TaxID=2650926 RepID=UPI0039E5DEC5